MATHPTWTIQEDDPRREHFRKEQETSIYSPGRMKWRKSSSWRSFVLTDFLCSCVRGERTIERRYTICVNTPACSCFCNSSSATIYTKRCRSMSEWRGFHYNIPSISNIAIFNSPFVYFSWCYDGSPVVSGIASATSSSTPTHSHIIFVADGWSFRSLVQRCWRHVIARALKWKLNMEICNCSEEHLHRTRLYHGNHQH